MKEEDWDAVLNINLKGTFLCSKEAIRLMSRQRYGRIVNIASVVAFMGNPGQANYGASKAGIVGLTKTTAREYASRGVTANAVAPGFITTAMTDALPENVRNEMMKSIPMGRFGTVEDVANAVAFFAAPETGYITGQVIHINGGMYM
jgi:3-oxoacyl-[acyl-carrier protein] reductase